MPTILITGCVGFIGSHLSERLLNEGYQVVGLDNFDPFYDRYLKESNLALLRSHPGFTFCELNLCHGEEALAMLPSGPYDAVVHLAAKAGVGPSVREPAEYLKNNLLGTTYLLEWMQQQAVPNLVFASSSSVYGNTPNRPFREDDSLLARSISPYAASKLAGEALTHTYHHLYKIGVLNTRLFTVYGPRQRPDLAIHKFASRLRNGQSLPIYGDGSTSRDYTYVADIVDGLVRGLAYLQAHPGTYETVNLGNGSPISLIKLITALGQATGVEPQLEYLPMQAGDMELTYADNRKAQQLLGYEPRTSLAQGLQNFVHWLNEYHPLTNNLATK